jgi:sortase A
LNIALQHLKITLGIITGLLLVGCSEIIQIVPPGGFVPVSPVATAPVPLVESTPTPEIIRHQVSSRINYGSGSPTRIVAETINLDAPVVEMGWHIEEKWGQVFSVWDMPVNEAAWHRNSAWPGQGSNVVISGHNASLGGQVFANLEDLEVGDLVTIWNDADESFIYQVREKNIIRVFAPSAEAQEFLQTSMDPMSQERLTLITCWPRWTNTHRLIIVAEPYKG